MVETQRRSGVHRECIENKETREWALGNTYPRAVELAKKELGEGETRD